MNRQAIFHSELEVQRTRDNLATAPETYQEDRAFMNRMKVLRFRDMSETEFKRLWRIALKGMDVRENVENEIRSINNEIHKREQDGTLDCGYKLGWKLQEDLVRMKGLR